MLISPAVLGLISGLVMFVRTDAPAVRLGVLLAVLVAWFFGYFAFFAFGLAARARNPKRRAKYLTPVYVYGAISAVGIATALLLQPELMRWAVPFAPLVVIAVWETLRGRSRSTLSGVSTTVASALLYPALTSVGAASAEVGTQAWAAMIFLAVYFSGTIPFVKCMIRERNNPRYLAGSIAYHVMAVLAGWVMAAAMGVGWVAGILLVGTLLVALFRSMYIPMASHRGDNWTARRLGMAEIPVLLLACVAVLATIFN